METNSYHRHISSQHNNFDLKLKEVWQYRDLLILLIRRNFKITYRQTILGPLWFIIYPLLTSIVYMIIFSRIAGLSTEGAPSLLFYMVGNALWLYFSGCLSGNSGIFLENAGLFGKVYFPRLTVPISNVIIELVSFFLQLAVILLALLYFTVRGSVSPNWWAWVFLIPILLELGLMGMGLGMILSAATAKYRDLSVLLRFGVTLWMYVTPVVYPLSQLNDGILRTLIMLNPATAPFELFRYAVLGNGTISIPGQLYSLSFSAVIFVLGVIVFNKVERTFMDTV